MTGAITAHIDVAQIALYAFWLFFFGLIFYLRREDRREGYPLESEVTGEARQDTAIWMAKPKIWKMPGGGTEQAPRASVNEPPLGGERISRMDGAPYEATGNPLTGAFGPAAYALRANEPDMTGDGHTKIVPMRTLSEFDILKGDTDPRGLPVLSLDDQKVGTISDVWIDRSESVIRYFEIELDGTGEGEGAPRRILVPRPMATVKVHSLLNKITPRVRIHSLRADQFGDVPMTKNNDSVTKLEEDKISAYYAGGEFYNHRATPPGSFQ